MTINDGRVARTAGLVITTAIATAAIQNTTWDGMTRAVTTFGVIVIGALLAAAASDYDLGD
jgi:hypothetical protein